MIQGLSKLAKNSFLFLNTCFVLLFVGSYRVIASQNPDPNASSLNYSSFFIVVFGIFLTIGLLKIIYRSPKGNSPEVDNEH